MWNRAVVIFLVINSISAQFFIKEAKNHPDAYLSIEQLINKYGYVVEVHEVVTEDDYILTMFRIPHGRKGTGVNRKPILLMHGLLGQAENFVINAINNGSLAYFLADNNYDVWLGNNRGTQHGMKHKVLSYKDQKFWNFSFHEQGIYDLPALIDHVLKTTKKKNIFYAGYSQGGTIFYIMASLKPEYQKKIALASLLAPSGYHRHLTNPVLLSLAVQHKALGKLVEMLSIHALPPAELHLRDIIDACSTSLHELCLIIYLVLTAQQDYAEFNREMLPLILKFTSSASVKQLLHYAQTITSGYFRPYDFGEQRNVEIYGKPQPDDYPVRNIEVPTAIYYSYGDQFVFAEDVEDMCDALPNCVNMYLIKKQNWSHYDFIFGVNMATQLIGPILEFAKKYDVKE